VLSACGYALSADVEELMLQLWIELKMPRLQLRPCTRTNMKCTSIPELQKSFCSYLFINNHQLAGGRNTGTGTAVGAKHNLGLAGYSRSKLLASLQTARMNLPHMTVYSCNDTSHRYLVRSWAISTFPMSLLSLSNREPTEFFPSHHYRQYKK